ncbi:MAG: anti-sigma factor [Chitinophagaceae bacterium]
MNVKDIISSGLLELYITGLASEEETLQVEQWIKEYPEVKKEIEDLQDVIERYALAEAIQPEEALKEKILFKIQPDDSVKEKIFSRLQSSTKEDTSSGIKMPAKNERAVVYSMPSYFKWAAAASIILLLGSLILNYTYYSKYKNTSKDLQVAQQELQKQQQLADGLNKDMDVMTDKNAMPVVLNGTPRSPDALAKIFWMKNTGEVYVDPTNLPQAPAGMQYQLWAIVDGKPLDAGMISTEKGIYHIQKMKTFGKAQAFAITMEKAGGSPTPTMDQMIVHAKI